MNKVIFILSILMFGAISCKKVLTGAEYKKYVSDPGNGLRKDQTVGKFDLSVMYEPVEYLLAREGNTANQEQRRKELSKFEHFQFRIRLNEGGNILLYRETQDMNEVTRINHFSFMAQQDFMIIAGHDTNRCKLAHFSRNYNLSPTVDLSLAFDKIEKDNDWQLIYTDQQFNLGTVKFLFKEEDLSDLPELKM